MSRPSHPLTQITELLQSSGAPLIEFQDRAVDGQQPRAPLADPAAAVVAALAEPLEFPPLRQAIVPGDRVAIAVDDALPQIEQLVVGLIESLREIQVAFEEVTVVAASEATFGLLQGRLPVAGASPVEVVLHDPTNEKELCYVGTTRSGATIRINRVLYDADVVLPVGCARLRDTLGYGGTYDCLYPQFADAAALQKWRTPRGHAPAQQAERVRAIDEAGWLLGVALIVQVVPGPRGSVLGVVAGSPTAVDREAQRLSDDYWCRSVVRRASLVVATVSGEPREQTWQNVARAVAAAGPLVTAGGALAICSDLQEAPGAAFRHLCETLEFDSVQRALEKKSDPDSLAAWQLAQALAQGPVYFMSQLDADAIEDFGLAPIGELEELARLARRHDSVLVLEDAHHVAVRVGD